MKYKRKSDGKVFPSLGAAVAAFKCPGPCTPDCALYPAKPVPDKPGSHVHMCNPDWYKHHRAEIAAELGLEPVLGTEGWQDYYSNVAYIAVIASRAVRDVQVCSNADCEPADDDGWYDAKEPELFLGVFSGPDALEQAAAFGCTVPENIRLIPAADLVKKGGNKA